MRPLFGWVPVDDRAYDRAWQVQDILPQHGRHRGAGTVDYYADDLAYRQTANGKRQTWRLDAATRFRSWKTETGSGTTWTRTGSKVNRYGDDSDTPRRLVEDTASGAVSRDVSSVSGDLAAITGKTGDNPL